ncbi:aminotransferase class III-fold pyridoxal phosphate-dependent enzyme [Bradyrhizobium sp. 174]|uniref:aminotransferase class III-fold pyridoxal phosphate-dependent enzyme n=1 Tax=Bradyrhizobium sp. 174 TaxID=2782645 RepID=UPI0031F5F14A
MGCGRTGEFFSFEFSALSRDIIVMSKSLSGYGLPLSMLLIKNGRDAWRSGEHTGTFRGNNLALVSATAAINLYWRSRTLSQEVQQMGELMRLRLEVIAAQHGNNFAVRGRGMALGFDLQISELAEVTARKAFDKGLIVERCGPGHKVVKFLPALAIDREILNQGLEIFEVSVAEALNRLERSI